MKTTLLLNNVIENIFSFNDTDSENNYQQITDHIETLNKKNNINLIVLNFEKKFSLKNDFENYLLNLNKKVLFITNEPISFNSKFIYREQIVNSKYLTYINNDIQYGSRYIAKRVIDIVVSVFALILLLPIFVFVYSYYRFLFQS